MDNQAEYIICAAIYYPDGIVRAHQPKNIESGLVICGRRHHNIFVILKEAGLSKKGVVPEQGFLTSKDRFVHRSLAAHYAFSSGQIKEPKNILFSEDIY